MFRALRAGGQFGRLGRWRLFDWFVAGAVVRGTTSSGPSISTTNCLASTARGRATRRDGGSAMYDASCSGAPAARSPPPHRACAETIFSHSRDASRSSAPRLSSPEAPSPAAAGEPPATRALPPDATAAPPSRRFPVDIHWQGQGRAPHTLFSRRWEGKHNHTPQ